jgi:hypothetical protein
MMADDGVRIGLVFPVLEMNSFYYLGAKGLAAISKQNSVGFLWS